mgnify:CR=1 FL=1
MIPHFGVWRRRRRRGRTSPPRSFPLAGHAHVHSLRSQRTRRCTPRRGAKAGMPDEGGVCRRRRRRRRQRIRHPLRHFVPPGSRTRRCTPKRQGRQNTGEGGADKIRTSPLRGRFCRLVRGKWLCWRQWRHWHWHSAANSFCSSSGGGVAVKCGTPSCASRFPAAAQGAARQSVRGGKRQKAWTRPPQPLHGGMDAGRHVDGGPVCGC